MRRFWRVVALILLCGCTPPVYFDILNNTGTELVINTPKGAIRLPPAMSMEFAERELAERETDPQGNLTLSGASARTPR